MYMFVINKMKISIQQTSSSQNQSGPTSSWCSDENQNQNQVLVENQRTSSKSDWNHVSRKGPTVTSRRSKVIPEPTPKLKILSEEQRRHSAALLRGHCLAEWDLFPPADWVSNSGTDGAVLIGSGPINHWTVPQQNNGALLCPTC